jgi:hypothetical protein
MFIHVYSWLLFQKMKLLLLSILPGAGMSVPQVYALTMPARFTVTRRGKIQRGFYFPA